MRSTPNWRYQLSLRKLDATAALCDTRPMTEPPDAPEWIDFTPSDPGLTVLQLFA